MHVAPPSPHLAKVPESDARKLLGSLSALLEQFHAQSLRLVVFDLGQQKVLFRKDGFTAADVEHVTKLINDARYGVVDYSTLRNPKGATDLLTQLTETERGALHASDALIFSRFAYANTRVNSLRHGEEASRRAPGILPGMRAAFDLSRG